MLKEIIKISDRDTGEWVAAAVDVLHRGGVVAFPTETVYGLAVAPGVPGALDKLNALKLRPPEKPYTLHIGSGKRLYDFVPDPPWFARVFARKAWPGPLTLVVTLDGDQIRRCREKYGELFDKLYHENSIGIRCPDHPAAARLLNQFPLPVVAPSANPADQPPALDARQVEDYFADRVDLILDAGPVQYRKSSTVVKVDRCGYEIVRKGVFDVRTVDRLAGFTILFVCSGNTCRSPMAEGLCRKILPEIIGCTDRDLDALKINIVSAGTFAGRGMPATQPAIAAAAALGADITHHRSQPLTAALVKKADIIFPMSTEHKDFICDLVPEACDRVKLISEAGVPDPIGGSDREYAECAGGIARLLEARLKELVE